MATDTLNFPNQPINVSFIPLSEAAVLFRSIVREELARKQEEDLQEKVCTSSEIRALLKITQPTLNKWEKEGKIKAYRIGSRVRYKYSEVISSLETLKKYKKVAL